MRGWVDRVAAGLRQHGHHRAFRVPAPGWDAAAQERIVRLLAAQPRAEPPAVEPPVEPAPAGQAAPAGPRRAQLVEAATDLWRARRRLARMDGTGGPGVQQTGHYLRNCVDALAASGLVIQDHDGDDYHPGLALEVLEWEERPTLRRETVVRTVRPTIYLHDHNIRTGAVIVGYPVDGAPARREDGS